MSLESVLERFATLYASGAAYVMGPEGYRLWLESLGDALRNTWPLIVAGSVAIAVYGGYRGLTRWRQRERRRVVGLFRRPRPIFRKPWPWQRLPLVYDPGGFGRRRPDGRWR